MKEYNNKIINMIAEAKQAFIAQKDISKIIENVYLFEILFENKKYRFFGVNKNHQYDLNYDLLRKFISNEILGKTDLPIMEVIGDSTQFDYAGSQFAKQHFINEIKDFNGLLLYGYTGTEDLDQGLLDVNGIVNNYINQNPNFAERVLANIVDFDTRIALGSINEAVPTIADRTGWGAIVSEHVCNFFLVWDNLGNGALFGDDAFLSDKLVNSKALLYAGGLQSFLQATNILNYGYQVIGVSGIRGSNNPATFIKGDGYNRHVLIFETAYFLNLIKETFKERKNVTIEEMNQLKNSYLCDEKKPKFEEQRALLINPFRKDLDLRLRLWQQGWENFIQHATWNKIQTNLYIARNCSEEKLLKADEIIIDPFEVVANKIGTNMENKELLLTKNATINKSLQQDKDNEKLQSNNNKPKFCIML